MAIAMGLGVRGEGYGQFLDELVSVLGHQLNFPSLSKSPFL